MQIGNYNLLGVIHHLTLVLPCIERCKKGSHTFVTTVETTVANNAIIGEADTTGASCRQYGSK